MERIPLICPRCGQPQRVVPGGADRVVRVVHSDTGREACGPDAAGSDAGPGGASQGGRAGSGG
ncbi:hypothetical protein [Streptomyces sp. CB03911]|uniref:hypothetical protein n=1 Tax=Streptomycetaceae TaxID=2062 RepID=UPI00093F9578|nr:hypothetical protein [Streptomyces sp. CB03911]OKI20091.1 hypothetical protein A6A07_37205 [Streptomyces sp. CB03911]